MKQPTPVIHQPPTAETVDIYDDEKLLGAATIDGSHWSFTVDNLSPGLHAFTARSSGAKSNKWAVTVTESNLNLPVPHVNGATPGLPNSERLDYYTINDDIQVVIPDYGIKLGDSVGLYWTGRGGINLFSEQTAAENPPALLPFSISKYQVIDAILTTAVIYYTVKRKDEAQVHPSPTLILTVEGHTFPVNAPTINGAHDNLRVWKQNEFNNGTTAGVRAIGPDGDEWSADSTPAFGGNDYLNFEIDPSWLARNRGRSAIFNCSIRLNPSDPHYLFSQLLRIQAV